MLNVLAITNMYPSEERPDWGTFVKDQIDSLKAMGINVSLLVIDGYKTKANYLKAIAQMRRLCRNNRFDVIHAHYGLSGLVARFQFATPVVVSYCGSDLLGNPDQSGRATFESKILAGLHRLLSKTVSDNIVKSRQMGDLILSRRVNVIPNGVDLDHFRPLDQKECRQKIGLPDDRIFICFPAHPSRIRKNYKLLEEAVAIINQNEDRQVEIKTMHGIDHADVPLYLNACDALALPSLWEGSPNIIKEAMACNRPIVSTNVGDVAELLDGVKGSRICECRPDRFAEGLADVLWGADRPDGRAHIEYLSQERVAARVAAVLQTAHHHAKPPRETRNE